ARLLDAVAHDADRTQHHRLTRDCAASDAEAMREPVEELEPERLHARAIAGASTTTRRFSAAGIPSVTDRPLISTVMVELYAATSTTLTSAPGTKPLRW